PAIWWASTRTCCNHRRFLSLLLLAFGSRLGRPSSRNMDGACRQPYGHSRRIRLRACPRRSASASSLMASAGAASHERLAGARGLGRHRAIWVRLYFLHVLSNNPTGRDYDLERLVTYPSHRQRCACRNSVSCRTRLERVARPSPSGGRTRWRRYSRLGVRLDRAHCLSNNSAAIWGQSVGANWTSGVSGACFRRSDRDRRFCASHSESEQDQHVGAAQGTVKRRPLRRLWLGRQKSFAGQLRAAHAGGSRSRGGRFSPPPKDPMSCHT